MIGSTPLYELEIWSKDGHRLADITGLARNRAFTLKRNDTWEASFELDIFDFERFAKAAGIHPRALLTPLQNDVLIKRAGQYWFGTQIATVTFNLTNDPSGINEGSTGRPGKQNFNPTISVACTGYLNLLKDRYVNASYTGAERCFVAGDIVNKAQAMANGSVGITLAASQYSTGVTDGSRIYTRQKAKDALQNLAALPDAPFDFDISYDKKFQTYQSLGSVRGDLQFTYGGSDSNVAGFYMDQDGSSLVNQVIALGDGFGPDQLVSDPIISGNQESQLNYFVRQGITQHNGDTIQDTLNKNAAADLALSKDLLQIPQFTVSGTQLMGVPFPIPGDRIPLTVIGHLLLDNIHGLYRVEKMVVTPDDNDTETVMFYSDNYNIGDS